MAIAYGAGLFVAINTNYPGYRVMTSPDGITWTMRATPADNSWRGIYWNGSLFVAVASDGTGNRIMTSPDGINWTIRSTAGMDWSWQCVCWGNGMWVVQSTFGSKVLTSPDGVTWTMYSTPANCGAKRMVYNNLKFVGVIDAANVTRSVWTAPAV
jgi:hypothetical protein